ncbi:hypothetical protein [Blastococcus saxobsidens]|uniref:Uncharacterized protein n=1 Tax=Blastococcus saxobsidens (strain DD2) TaxID=1146883 RepID=H6RL85_BLASD|nr:hypothetical protein [Blastococcus saxobsidens]CCG01215.1 exported protein of unknown function [Blastococcus saxobsidens DD2]
MTRPETPPAPPAQRSSRSRRRLLVAAVSVVLLAGGVSAWWLLRSSPVEAVPAVNVALPDVDPGEPQMLMIALLCLDGAETATIDGVTADRAGLIVTDFAVRPAESGEPTVGAFDGTLRESGFSGGRTVTVACADDTYSELAVEVSRGVNGPAHTDDFHLHWRSGVRSGALPIEASVTLCASGQVDEYCAPVPPGS